MDAQPDEDVPVESPDAADPADTAAASTGHPAVDEVLRSLDELDARPVDEHVAAFERAHETLRRTLSGAGDESGDESGDETGDETGDQTGDVGTTPPGD